MARHLEETDIPIEYKGMKYNVSPSALRSNNLTVELPEVKVLGKRKNKGYKSAFNPNGAGEFAGTILNTPLMLADRGANAIGISGTPVQTVVQRVGETFSPTRWIGTARSGFKESPWSENNPGLTGDPYLDTIIDIGVGGFGIKGGKYIKNLRQNIELTNKINKEKPIIEAFRKGLKEADDYKNSEGYKELIQKAREESKQLGFGDFSDELFINAGKKEYPLLKIEPRNKGAVAGYKYSANRISIDPSQLNKYERDAVPYHESLHYKRIGNPEFNTPKYKAWTKSFDDKLPENIQSKLWDDFYNSDEYYTFKERNNAETYLDHKINNALRESADPYLKIKGELQANGLEAGKAIGIKPFTKYPGIKDATEAYIKAKNYNPILLGLKTKTPQDFKNIWDILTGNYIPSAIPLTIGGKYIYNNLNNNK